MAVGARRIERIVPGLAWLRSYRARYLPRDLAGGLAVGSMLIPQGLAFAQIVQVPPVAGLWSGIAAMIGYAFFGPSRHLMAGPEAGTAMMAAAFITSAGIEDPEQRLAAAAVVALMVAGVALSALLGFESMGIRVLGRVEPDLPSLGIPQLPGGTVMRLVPGALSLALLIYASSVLTSRIFADKNRYEFRANGEFFGISAANLLCGLIGGVPAAGSDARTVINDATRTKTQAAGLFAAATVLAIILLLAPVMALLPNALLGAIVIGSALSLFDLRGLVKIWKVRPIEGGLALITFAGVLVLGILPGVLVAVALAIGDLVRRAAHPHDAVLGRVEGRPGYQDIEQWPGSETFPGLIIYRLDAPLFFANARFLREQIHKLLGAADEPVRMVVLDCGAMFDLDVTAAETLEKLDRELDERGIVLALAEPHAPMRTVLGRTGLLQKLGEEHIFATVGEAIRAYERGEATQEHAPTSLH